MRKIGVSAVKYTNSIPFIYGLQNHSIETEISLSLDSPAQCYNNLFCGHADICLVPVIFKNHVSSVYQISPYIIGATGDVLSVILVSKVPLSQIKTITLDYQSRTSVMLTRLLCRDFWKINPEFVHAKPGFEDKDLASNEAYMIIGDRAFAFHKQKDLIITDLAGEWIRFTSLPFVFAIWASTQRFPAVFEDKFSDAISFGLSHKARLAKEMSTLSQYESIDLPRYLNENIIHEITPSMYEGMNLFLHLIRDFQ
jgi:chorismate dehydratase